jgi:hypothetical protein
MAYSACATTNRTVPTKPLPALPGSQFRFSLSQNSILKVDLAGSHNLLASGILRADSSPADN